MLATRHISAVTQQLMRHTPLIQPQLVKKPYSTLSSEGAPFKVDQGVKTDFSRRHPQFSFNFIEFCEKAFNNALDFPLQKMNFQPFKRIDIEDGVDLSTQKRQNKSLSFSEFLTRVSQDIPVGEAGLVMSHQTRHEGALYLGYYPDSKGEISRCLVKVFPPHMYHNANAEELFAYVMSAWGGESGQSVLKTVVYHLTNQKELSKSAVVSVRRFAKGEDLGMLSSALEDLKKGDPREKVLKKYAIPEIPLNQILTHIFIRYVLLGDFDFENPDNLLFNRGSSLTQAQLIHIDPEDTFAVSTNKQAPSGSWIWRKDLVKEINADAFFEHFAKSTNPLMQYLRLFFSIEDMARLEIPRETIHRAIEMEDTISRMSASRGILSLETLSKKEANHQLVTAALKQQRNTLKPLTLKALVTADF